MRPITKILFLFSAIILFFQVSGDAQSQFLQAVTAPGGGMDYEGFGNDVAFTDDWMVVGAIGSLNSINNESTGGAYVYRKSNANSWEFFTKLEETDNGLEGFGWRVAIENDLIVVGVPEADLPSRNNGGVVYLYRFDGNNWVKITRFEGDWRSYGLGNSVEINGEWIFVSMPGSEQNGVIGSGSVKVLKRNGNTVALHQTISLDTSFERQGFGVHLAAADSLLLVGSYAPSGPFYKETHLYQFKLRGDTWEYDTEINAPSRTGGNDIFGQVFSFDENYLAVGARLDQEGVSTAVGAVYLFEYGPNGWEEIEKIRPTEDLALIEFGNDVSLRNNTLAISANLLFRQGIPAFGGVVYFYQKMQNGTWEKVDSVTRNQLGNEQYFNFAPNVCSDGEFAAIGNPTGEIQGEERGKVYWVDYQGSLITSNKNLRDNHSAVSYFPNPILTHLTLKVENDFITKVEVLGPTGKIVFNQNNLYTQIRELDLSSLHRGIYFLRVWTGDGINVQKVIKL